MPISLEPAASADAAAIAALRNAVADDLTRKHGRGWWSGGCTERGVLFDLRHSSIYGIRNHDGTAFTATLRLATKKPWAIDQKYFTPCARPLYLTSMAVAPDCQRQGLGRQCLAAAVEIARRFPAQAICIDAFDHDHAGAGPFYAKCGFREVGRATYRSVPLIYYERLV